MLLDGALFTRCPVIRSPRHRGYTIKAALPGSMSTHRIELWDVSFCRLYKRLRFLRRKLHFPRIRLSAATPSWMESWAADGSSEEAALINGYGAERSRALRRHGVAI
ncbi:uncharacterized [Tachysurus ichikawai]